VQNVWAQVAKHALDGAARSQTEPRPFAYANEARPEGFSLGRQGTRSLEAEDRNLLAETPPLADQIDDDAFEPTNVER